MIEKNVIVEWCRQKNVKPKVYGNNPSVIILGEDHSEKKHREQQEEIIKLVKPEYLLHEFFDGRFYNPITKEITYLPDVVVDKELEDILPKDCVEDRRLIGWAEKYRLFLVGIDLTFTELDRLRCKLLDKSPLYAGSIKKDLLIEAKEDAYREKNRMGKRIVEYSSKTSKPLVVIMGGGHARPKSKIHPVIQKAGIDYICLDQGGSNL
jgi:hypothetical protein